MGEFQDFLSKFFCLTVPRISAGWELFSVLLISRIEKVWLRGGEVSRFSIQNLLFHRAGKFHKGTLLRCGSEKFRLRKNL